MDVLWDGDPPGRPVHALHGQVSRLRSVLPAEIERIAGGYRLDPASFTLGVTRFTDLTTRGRERLAHSSVQTSGEAARVLREALELWHGPALGDLSTLPGLQPVAEVEALLSDRPLNERHWGQLLRALHQDGLHTQALDAFQRPARSSCVNSAVSPAQNSIACTSPSSGVRSASR